MRLFSSRRGWLHNFRATYCLSQLLHKVMSSRLDEPSLKPPVHGSNHLPRSIRGQIVQHLLDLLDSSNFLRVHGGIDLRQKDRHPLQITRNTIRKEQQMKRFRLQHLKNLVPCFCTLLSSKCRADWKSPSCALPLLQSGTGSLQSLRDLRVHHIERAQRQSLANPGQCRRKPRPQMSIAFLHVLHAYVLCTNMQGHHRTIGHCDAVPNVQCHHGDPLACTDVHGLYPGADVYRGVRASLDVQPLEWPMHLLVEENRLVRPPKHHTAPCSRVAACQRVSQRSKGCQRRVQRHVPNQRVTHPGL
mmetsp:Transcript_9777/g.23312  ORF Transcript_9777/g.23312 Transcript_9777/m.23312 type:complete len:302 (+) Transcript_9777:85-990(+)